MIKIPPHNYTIRERSVIDILKQYQNMNIKSFLNVGFRNWDDVRNHWWIRICEENNIQWKILEIFNENVNNIVKMGCPNDKIICDDILNTDKYEHIDCLLFWHGPEHINKNIFIKKLPEIEKKVNKLIIFGMPLGFEPQNIIHGNENEKHISEWYEDDWKDLGYNTIVIKDQQQYPHITAYKILK